jgi:hypothetical protein
MAITGEHSLLIKHGLRSKTNYDPSLWKLPMRSNVCVSTISPCLRGKLRR